MAARLALPRAFHRAVFGRAERAVVLLAHPCEDSFNRALADRAVAALQRGGVAVDFVDLYATGFRAEMTAEEREAYHGDDPIRDPQVRDLADKIKAADTLVFVYPTWWSGLPAVLKGAIDRTLVPGVGFGFNDAGKVVPGLPNIRRLIGISTYGSPRSFVAAVNDNGRRTITRALRMSCGARTSAMWFGLYALDTATDEDRAAFLERIDERLGSLR